MVSPSMAPSNAELEVGGKSSDHLFQRSDASVTVNLPKHSNHIGDTVPPRRVEAPASVLRRERELTPNMAKSFHSKSYEACGASTPTKVHGPVTTGRRWPRWPRASDYFTQSDEVAQESTSAIVQPPRPVLADGSDKAISALVSKCQLASVPQPDINSSTSLNHSRDDMTITADQRIASQFLRALVALINEMRNGNTPLVTPSPASRPDMATQPAIDQPIRQKMQDKTDSKHEDTRNEKRPAGHAEQLDHLAALEAARITRLALKDKFEDDPLESSTHDAQPTKGPDSRNGQLQHLDALGAARITRLALKDKFEDDPLESSTHDAQPTKGPDSRNGQLQHLDALGAARITRLVSKNKFEDQALESPTHEAQPTEAPASRDGQVQNHDKLQAATYPRPTITIEPRDEMLATPYLLESMADGKIKLYLNGTTSGCTPGRLLYQTSKSDAHNLTQLGTSETRCPKVSAGIVDFVVERTQANYKLLVEAYYHLRLRKVQLANEWKRRNPTRAGSLVSHPYEVDPQHGPPPRHNTVPDTLTGLGRAVREDFEPWEITEVSLAGRRLHFARGRPVHADFSCSGEEEASYITASTASGGAHVERAKRPLKAIVLPESEEVYARLAWFVRHMSAKRWVAEAPPQSRKRSSEDALVGPGPAKKAKTADAPDWGGQAPAGVLKGGGESVLMGKQAGVVPQEPSVVLKQTAVMVLLNDG
ncbi:hypothetical protein CONLIGDRAFT_626660 [Coniochaeta ligniaria NRRL 30616]|uniref:Uncharacterized protein n=1 Tax=Coniochaeta ligniaria NRRL 30616 TaxID=1408157 RepID=A0A1J7J5A4_9PEZI|nr:hypothetical protein CONLIGDRAFT_626660 [Coniochaeta ligniaria NRRL 30616]